MREQIAEIESVLAHSGIASYLPAEVKEQICHSVALDLSQIFAPPPSEELISEEEQRPFIHNHKNTYGDVTLDEVDVDVQGLLQSQANHTARIKEAKIRKILEDIRGLIVGTYQSIDRSSTVTEMEIKLIAGLDNLKAKYLK